MVTRLILALVFTLAILGFLWKVIGLWSLLAAGALLFVLSYVEDFIRVFSGPDKPED